MFLLKMHWHWIILLAFWPALKLVYSFKIWINKIMTLLFLQIHSGGFKLLFFLIIEISLLIKINFCNIVNRVEKVFFCFVIWHCQIHTRTCFSPTIDMFVRVCARVCDGSAWRHGAGRHLSGSNVRVSRRYHLLSAPRWLMGLLSIGQGKAHMLSHTHARTSYRETHTTWSAIPTVHGT